jgi:predicted MFS family arabinose efflux permease
VALWAAFGLPPMPATPQPGLGGVLAGLRFVAGNRPVRGALLTDLAATVLAMPISMFPVINAERFGGDPRTLGLFLTAIAVGGVVASAFSGSFTRLHRPGAVMIAAALIWGAALALFGIVPGVVAGLALLAVAGAADTAAVVSRSTVIQLHTPDAFLGRAAAAEQIAGQAGPDVGNLRGGLVAAAWSAPAALVSGGLLCVVAVALIAVRTPSLTRPSHPRPG